MPQPLKCTVDTAAECAAGEICAASSKCFNLTCSGLVIATTDCANGTGLCMPAQRQPVSAALTPAADAIIVALNAPAKAAAFPCSQLFSAATAALVGAQAYCYAQGSTLAVQLPASATILPGDSLAINSTQRVLVDELAGSAYFNGSVTVAACSGECQTLPPVAVLMAPAVRG